MVSFSHRFHSFVLFFWLGLLILWSLVKKVDHVGFSCPFFKSLEQLLLWIVLIGWEKDFFSFVC